MLAKMGYPLRVPVFIADFAGHEIVGMLQYLLAEFFLSPLSCLGLAVG